VKIALLSETARESISANISIPMTNASILAFLDNEIERLKRARQLLEPGASGGSGVSRHPGRRGAWRMSAESRARISAAQKARWAERKSAQNGNSGAGPRRKMSAEGRARIAAAQKARWARQRSAQKKK
jgi:hypothetical protein